MKSFISNIGSRPAIPITMETMTKTETLAQLKRIRDAAILKGSHYLAAEMTRRIEVLETLK